MTAKTVTIEDEQDRGAITYIRGGKNLPFGIVMLSVKREHRGQGVGGQLLDKVIALADKEGADILLMADPQDTHPTALGYTDLLEFYMRRGFERKTDGIPNALIRRFATINCND